MNKKFFAALASATMAFSATGSLAVFAQDFEDEDNPVVPSTPKPTVDKIAWNEDNFGILANMEPTNFAYTKDGNTVNLSLNADKTVNTADLEKFTSITVAGTAAAPINGEVKGLEYFTGLTTFTSAATATSHATLTNDTLDFSANTALKTLDVENDKELSSIVLPNPTVNDDEEEVYSLTSLTLTGTALTSLDLSAQEALYDSTTPANPTTINVSGNKNLKELQLAKGTARNPMNVGTLNLSDNSLEDINLKNYTIGTSLDLDGNHLGTLDLSKTTLYGTINTPFAQKFYVAENAGSVNLKELFPSIDLTKVTEGTDDKFDDKTGVLTFGTSSDYTYTATDSTADKHTATLKVTFEAANPMYRLYNPNSGEHFYTANANEQEALVKLGWNDEGYGWVAPTKVDAEQQNYAPVYRLYNPNAGDHHYTKNENEKNILVSVGWKDEEIGWYSASDHDVPVYREYNPNAKAAGAHNYTTNKVENDFLLTVGWLNEGIAWTALQ